MLRKIMPGGVPSNSMARNLRAARSSIRSRSLINCASRWPGLVRARPSRSSRGRPRPPATPPRALPPTTRRSATSWSSDKKIKLVMVYPMTTGRNFQEILRSIDSLQMTAKHRVATPADWKQGEDVIIAGSVSDDEAKTIYPQGWKAPKPYIRIVPQPK